jgi:hypothetical protein
LLALGEAPDALEVAGWELAAAPDDPPAVPEVVLDELDAAADFDSSSLAFRCEVETAPLAFATSLVRPATPGAEPW